MISARTRIPHIVRLSIARDGIELTSKFKNVP